MRFCKLECLRVTVLSQPVNDRTTGITQPHDLRAFVNGLAGSIVDGLSENLHVIVCVYLYYLTVAAGDK